MSDQTSRPAYYDQIGKEGALWALLDYLVSKTTAASDGSNVMLQRQKAYDDAARRLREILNTPIALSAPDAYQPLRMEFGLADMCVAVVAPVGALGSERTLTFDRTTRAPQACTHRQEYPEGMRATIAVGYDYTIYNHAETIERQESFIRRLVTGMQEFIDTEALSLHYRQVQKLRGLIS